MTNATKQLDIVISARDEATKVLSGMGKTLANFKKDALIATAGIAAVGAAVIQLGTDAAKFESVSDAFNGMAREFDVSSADLIKSVRAATKNTVSDLNILKNANTAMTLIGKESFKDFGSDFTAMATIAKKAARATGQDVEFMFDSIVRGVGRASPLILDNLGITVRAEEVYKKYAETIGKSASDLTASEQKQALLNEVLQQGAEKYKDVAVSAGGLQGAQQELNATLENARMIIGTSLLPALNELVRTITPLITEYAPILAQQITVVSVAFNSLPGPIQAIFAGIVLLLPVMVALGAIITPLIAFFSAFASIVLVVIGIVATMAMTINGPLLNALMMIITNINLVTAVWKNQWNVMKDTVNNVVNWIRTIAWPSLLDIFEKIQGLVGRVAGGMIERFNAIRGAVESVINAIRGIISAAEGLANRAKGGLKIPGFQHGGFVPGSYGEAVPAILHGGERVIPRNGTDVNGGGGGGGANVTLNFTGPVSMDSPDRIQQLADQIIRILGRQNELAARGVGY